MRHIPIVILALLIVGFGSFGIRPADECHAISATVFKSPEFLERSKLFVPVYLDGDTENAQAYGEKFSVRGYPTMIVFDSDIQGKTDRFVLVFEKPR